MQLNSMLLLIFCFILEFLGRHTCKKAPWCHISKHSRTEKMTTCRQVVNSTQTVHVSTDEEFLLTVNAKSQTACNEGHGQKPLLMMDKDGIYLKDYYTIPELWNNVYKQIVVLTKMKDLLTEGLGQFAEYFHNGENSDFLYFNSFYFGTLTNHR